MKWFLDNLVYFVWVGIFLLLTGIFIDSAFLFLTGFIGFYLGVIFEEFPYLFRNGKNENKTLIDIHIHTIRHEKNFDIRNI